MQGISFNQVTFQKNIENNKRDSINKPKTDNSVKYGTSGADILATQNVAFLSKNKIYTGREIPEYNKDFVSDEAEGYYSYALRNDPEAFYLKQSNHIDKFLNKGELLFIDEDADEYYDMMDELNLKDTPEVKDLNRAIVDSVRVLDNIMENKTNDSLVITGYLPKDMMKAEKNSIIENKSYLLSTNGKNIKLDESMREKDKKGVEIWVPKGIPYADLTDNEKCAMLFPRGLKFSVIDDNSLEMTFK